MTRRQRHPKRIGVYLDHRSQPGYSDGVAQMILPWSTCAETAISNILPAMRHCYPDSQWVIDAEIQVGDTTQIITLVEPRRDVVGTMAGWYMRRHLKDRNK